MRKSKKFFRQIPLSVLIGGLILGFLCMISYACYLPLPSEKSPLLFYSNQTRQDLRLTFYKAIDSAKKSLFVSVYGITDPLIIKLLKKQSSLDLRIEYDASASSDLKQELPLSATAIQTRGLMHRKIVTIDQTTSFLGSANFTPTSLSHHGNLVLGIHHPGLARFLERPFSSHFSFSIDGAAASLFLLPDPSQESLTQILHSLKSASSRIYIAMFTLTHPQIIQELIKAKERGVDVQVAIDYYTAKGASKKSIDILSEKGIECHFSQGKELLHHKWALIDKNTFIMGSANWTQAAFTKNQDFVLLLSSLQKKHLRFIEKLWYIIVTEANQ